MSRVQRFTSMAPDQMEGKLEINGDWSRLWSRSFLRAERVWRRTRTVTSSSPTAGVDQCRTETGNPMRPPRTDPSNDAYYRFKERTMSDQLHCHHCRQSLHGQKYIQKDDEPCCVKCYEKFIANPCAVCKKPIGCGSKELHHGGKFWHEDCFRCFHCSRSLANDSFSIKNERIVCSKCLPRTDAATCHSCKRAIKAGTKSFEYGGSHWHERCFTCHRCLKEIGSQSFVPQGDEIYCVSCNQKKFAKHCTQCRKPITSGGVSYRDEPWHTECFVCKTCRKQLGGQQFTGHENFLYCVNCYSAFIAKKCGTCHKPVTGFGGAEIVTSEDRQWHKECFKCRRCYTSLVNKQFVSRNRDIYCNDCSKNL